VKKDNMNNYGCQSSERESIVQGERRGKEHGRIRLISFLVESEACTEDFADIVRMLCVVIC
jgi:hypothetical protein